MGGHAIGALAERHHDDGRRTGMRSAAAWVGSGPAHVGVVEQEDPPAGDATGPGRHGEPPGVGAHVPQGAGPGRSEPG